VARWPTISEEQRAAANKAVLKTVRGTILPEDDGKALVGLADIAQHAAQAGLPEDADSRPVGTAYRISHWLDEQGLVVRCEDGTIATYPSSGTNAIQFLLPAYRAKALTTMPHAERGAMPPKPGARPRGRPKAIKS